MRPGLAAELGLEYEQLAPRYPRDHRGDRDGVRRAGTRCGPRRDGPRRPGAQRPHGHGRQGPGRPADLGRVAHRGLHGGRAAGLRRRLRALSARADRAAAGAWTPRSCWPRSRCRTTSWSGWTDSTAPATPPSRTGWAQARRGGVPFAEQVERMPRNRRGRLARDLRADLRDEGRGARRRLRQPVATPQVHRRRGPPGSRAHRRGAG